ncbi:four helix bundle protein [Zeimonas sediminis]|uniref:four helix bundle protein n=1 Tax=Zeimonas sediminis TaxID=2944268 RepID=UPI003AEF7A5C
MGIAAGSLSELDTLIELAQRLGYLNDSQELRKTAEDVSGMLMGLQTSIRRRAEA